MSEFKYQQLARLLSKRIEQHILQAGDKLPSIRQLSQEFSLAKVSVQHALHYLEAQGLVEARPRSGYYVKAAEKEQQVVPGMAYESPPELVDVPHIFQQIMARGAAFDVFPSAPLHDHPPHIEILHRDISRAQRQRAQENALYYGPPEGDRSLRAQIQKQYKARNCALDVDEICITSGCQNSLFIALTACCQPGDTIAIESPAFYGVLQIAQQLGLKVLEIPCSSSSGMSVEALCKVITRWPVKACVVTPSYSTPTGACMPYHEKQKLVALAQQHQFFLIEDDIYGELGFSLQPEPLKHFDQLGQVILCSSFSKSLSRDLRIGWFSGGKLHEKMTYLKLVNQLSGSQSVQSGVAKFLAEGHYRRLLNRYRQRLKQRRDNLITALNNNWCNHQGFSVPDGGLTLWVKLPDHIDTHKMYQPLLQQGITITPGVLFSSQTGFRNYLRLSFAHTLDKPRMKALRTVGQFIQNC
ncbi:aminotransferase-like domain-containing protein [Planctobacterium marinum]|uniref:aminotransferase-like domain-containing protein n=1 Tax=Planctobacterium marinum TaxID=1631968 RepID=UPI001E61F9A5|nr:PLP-dependent aminotransferase family protein [Planctobacterium marinum]MCC2606514.1 PLP-dependent aminotransferase family protein [Planctobacterium marinum]